MKEKLGKELTMMAGFHRLGQASMAAALRPEEDDLARRAALGLRPEVLLTSVSIVNASRFGWCGSDLAESLVLSSSSAGSGLFQRERLSAMILESDAGPW